MLESRSTLRTIVIALSIGAGALAVRWAVSLSPVTEGINIMAAGGFTAGLLLGPLGVALVALADLAALVVVDGSSLPRALVHAGADALPGLLAFMVFRSVPGIGRVFPNLRSYLAFLAVAAAGGLAAGILMPDPTAFAFGTSVFGAVALIAPPLLILFYRFAPQGMTGLPGEVLPPSRVAEPLGYLHGSFDRPSGGRVFVLLTGVLLVTASIAVLLETSADDEPWFHLACAVPVLWASLNYGPRAGILVVSAIAFTLLSAWAVGISSGMVSEVPSWGIVHLADFLVLSLIAVAVGAFQERLGNAQVHEAMAVRQSEAQLRAIIDNAPEAIVILDLERQTFVLVNDSATELFGWPMDELLKLGPGDISPTWQPDGRLSQVAATEYVAAAVRGEKPAFEWTHQNAAGEPIACEVRLVRMPAPTRVLVRGSVLDLRQRLSAQQALQASEERYRRVVQEMTEPVVRWTPDGVRTFVNEAYCRVTGLSQEAILGTSFLAEASPAERTAMEDNVRRLRAGESPISDEQREVLASGEVIWRQWTDRGLFDDDGQLIELQSVGRDVTSLKRTEEELRRSQDRLRSLTVDLTFAEERERRRIANYLHDEIGQTLAIMGMKLATLKESDADEQRARTLREMRSLLADTIAKTRSFTLELSPPVLYELGLEAAAEWIGQRICAENGLEFTFDDDGEPKPLEDKALPLLFRGTRELLMNAVKHSGASRATVSIGCADGVVRLVVEDDGLGFDPSTLAGGFSDGGFGLFSLRERLRFLGGRLELDSEPGRGTRGVMIVPVATGPDALSGSNAVV